MWKTTITITKEDDGAMGMESSLALEAELDNIVNALREADGAGSRDPFVVARDGISEKPFDSTDRTRSRIWNSETNARALVDQTTSAIEPYSDFISLTASVEDIG